MPESRPALSLVAVLVKCFQKKCLRRLAGGFFLAANSLLGELFTALCRSYADRTTTNHQELLQLEKVVNYIREHYRTPIKREVLAKMLNMSEPTFFRRFKLAMSISPTEYILELRLKHAEELLRTTTLGLAEIALQSGFSDGNYLGVQFKKRFGQTPHRYRMESSKPVMRTADR